MRSCLNLRPVPEQGLLFCQGPVLVVVTRGRLRRCFSLDAAPRPPVLEPVVDGVGGQLLGGSGQPVGAAVEVSRVGAHLTPTTVGHFFI